MSLVYHVSASHLSTQYMYRKTSIYAQHKLSTENPKACTVTHPSPPHQKKNYAYLLLNCFHNVINDCPNLEQCNFNQWFTHFMSCALFTRITD